MEELKTTVALHPSASDNKNGSPSTNPVRKVQYPEYWKKKRLKGEIIKDLERSANSEPLMSDQHGEYRTGTFLHGCAIVLINIIDDLLCVEIHSEQLIGLPMIRDIRYKFLPDNMVFAQIFPPRKGVQTNNIVTLYQIPGEIK